MIVSSSGLRQGPRIFWFSELVSDFIIWKDNFLAFITKNCKFDYFKCGGLHEKHAVATWEQSQRLLNDGGKPRNPLSRWPVAGTFQIHTDI
jgi:hypothetical protein